MDQISLATLAELLRVAVFFGLDKACVVCLSVSLSSPTIVTRDRDGM